VTLEQLFSGRPVDIQGTKERLRRTAAELGLPFGESDRIYNTRLAQELALWAESRGRAEPFHMAVFKAYFVDGKNIGNIPILVELAASADLPADEAEKVLVTGSFKAAVDGDWAISRALRITAVPTFIMRQDRLVGAQPYEALQNLMNLNGINLKHH
jgi:predicted DsbA family dithiol-disulfide isomerase